MKNRDRSLNENVLPVSFENLLGRDYPGRFEVMQYCAESALTVYASLLRERLPEGEREEFSREFLESSNPSLYFLRKLNQAFVPPPPFKHPVYNRFKNFDAC